MNSILCKFILYGVVVHLASGYCLPKTGGECRKELPAYCADTSDQSCLAIFDLGYCFQGCLCIQIVNPNGCQKKAPARCESTSETTCYTKFDKNGCFLFCTCESSDKATGGHYTVNTTRLDALIKNGNVDTLLALKDLVSKLNSTSLDVIAKGLVGIETSVNGNATVTNYTDKGSSSLKLSGLVAFMQALMSGNTTDFAFAQFLSWLYPNNPLAGLFGGKK